MKAKIPTAAEFIAARRSERRRVPVCCAMPAEMKQVVDEIVATPIRDGGGFSVAAEYATKFGYKISNPTIFRHYRDHEPDKAPKRG